MKISALIACVLLGLTAAPVAAQNSLETWYEAAEQLRRDGETPDDLQKSRDIHFQLLKSGYSRSLIPYAELHLEMNDIDTAMRAFEEAANSGNLYAITRVAQAHATGAFGDKSKPQAGVDLLRKLSVNPDNGRAIIALAEILTDGQVVEADPTAALKLYMRLPDNRTAMRRIAQLHMSGDLGKINPEAAIEAYGRAISLGSVGLNVRLAEAQLAAGKYEDADATLEAAIVEGDERALLQMVRWHRDGAFGPLSDPARGVAALEKLAASGAIDDEAINKFRVSLAGQQLEDSLYREAAKTLEPAVIARDPRALYRFMRWHLDRQFGSQSDPIAGLAALRELLEKRDVNTAIFASFRLEDEVYTQVFDQATVIDILTEATENGDGAATRALARAYRVADIKGPHRDLIERYANQIPLDRRVLELVYASHNPRDLRGSRKTAEEILTSVGGTAFVEGMLQLRSLERTSYVYVLQAELAKLGYYNGNQNGKLTQRTISAMLNFCRTAGIIADCRSGPISKENSQLILEAMARRKRVTSS